MLQEILLSLFPDFKEGDWILMDLGDGDGQFIAQWNRTEPQPTADQIAAQTATYNSDAYQLKLQQPLKINAINDAASASASLLTEGYPDFETKTWPDQQNEALAWNADNTVATPTIDAMAGYRGIDRVTYLQKTVAKVQYFQKASAYLVGTRQKYVDQANAATTLAELNAINPVFTLPAP